MTTIDPVATRLRFYSVEDLAQASVCAVESLMYAASWRPRAAFWCGVEAGLLVARAGVLRWRAGL